jgi:hypothetical protein
MEIKFEFKKVSNGWLIANNSQVNVEKSVHKAMRTVTRQILKQIDQDKKFSIICNQE